MKSTLLKSKVFKNQGEEKNINRSRATFFGFHLFYLKQLIAWRQIGNPQSQTSGQNPYPHYENGNGKKTIQERNFTSDIQFGK